jgi:hypothetical protein
MPDEKRNPGNPQQDRNPNRDRQSGGRSPSRNPNTTEPPDSGQARRDEDEEE